MTIRGTFHFSIILRVLPFNEAKIIIIIIQEDYEIEQLGDMGDLYAEHLKM